MNASEVLKGLLKGDSILDKPQIPTGIPLKLKSNPQGFKWKVLDEISNESVDISNLLNSIEIEKEVKASKDNTEELLDNIKTYENVQGSILWTEKYRPKKFIDLIGNERVNSNILKWLNDWGYCVSEGGVKEDSPDPFNRPNKKFLLIHGPPGIGKTTIGHCIANQLKYDINEINSSDERSGEAVREKILNSLRVNNLKGNKICLILDEVDGASNNEGGFLRMLTQLSYKDKRAVDKFKNGGSGNREKLKNGDLIKRPIILICNDIYSPVLDQIKPHCEIYQFKKPSNSDIKKRLKKIIELENIKTPDTIIDDLIISMDGDIRNCINFLQFNSQNGSLDGRLKDTQIAWFQTLKLIFNRKSSIGKISQFNTLSRDLSNSNDRIDRIINGAFNGILQIENLNIAKYSEINDWFEFFDEVHKKSRLFERDELVNYSMVTPLKVYQMFNEIGMNQELNFKSMANYDTRKSIDLMLKEMKFKNLSTNGDNLKMFELDMLFKMIVPLGIPLKRLNIDKVKIERILDLVDISDLRIDTVKSGNYFSRETIDKLAPDISLMGMSSGSFGTTGEVDQIVSGYINILKGFKLVSQKRKAEPPKDETTAITPGEASADLPDPKRLKIGSSVDFFKRQYNSFSHAKAKTDNAVMAGNKNRIWVKFHEGFSNAVRKETSWELLFGSGNMTA